MTRLPIGPRPPSIPAHAAETGPASRATGTAASPEKQAIALPETLESYAPSSGPAEVPAPVAPVGGGVAALMLAHRAGRDIAFEAPTVTDETFSALTSPPKEEITLGSTGSPELTTPENASSVAAEAWNHAGVKGFAVSFLRLCAQMQAGGELPPEADEKLKVIQRKLGKMAEELEGAAGPKAQAEILVRAFLSSGVQPDDVQTANTQQKLVLGSAIGLVGALAAKTLISVHSLPQVIALALGTLIGNKASNAISSVLHHALDNYSFEQIPALAAVASEFQEHHADQAAITKQSFALTAYTSSLPVIPIVGAVLALQPGVAVGAIVGTIALITLVGQEGHKVVHRAPRFTPLIYDVAQLLGLAITADDHKAHHRKPHEDHYAMISGNPADDGPAYRQWEALIYKISGIEPNCWKHDPNLRVEALGPKGYDPRAVAALELRDREYEELKKAKSEQDERLRAGETLQPGEKRITKLDVEKKREEVPDRNRIAPTDEEGAQTPFVVNLRTLLPW